MYNVIRICTSKGSALPWRRYPLKAPWLRRSRRSASGNEREKPQPTHWSVGTRDSPPGLVWIAATISNHTDIIIMSYCLTAVRISLQQCSINRTNTRITDCSQLPTSVSDICHWHRENIRNICCWHKQDVQLVLTNSHDAFGGQSRSTDTVPFWVHCGLLLHGTTRDSVGLPVSYLYSGC